jgi:predicted N-acetyltransferase YhbS
MKLSDAVRIVDSRELSFAKLESLYDDILATSFAPPELVARNELLADLVREQSVSCGCLALDSDGTVVGGMIGEWFPDCRVMLISYLAVRSAFRGHGLGKRLIKEGLEQWSARFAPLLVVGEVEDPRYYRDSDPAGFGDARARLRLYASLGARVLPVPYFQPSLRALQPRVYHLLLMVFAADPLALKGDRGVDAQVVRGFLEENIARCEGTADDDEAQSLRKAVQGTDAVPLQDPSEYFDESDKYGETTFSGIPLPLTSSQPTSKP